MSIPFIDLKAQYEALKPSIQKRINDVLEHGQYIMGPEVYELEQKLQAYSGAKHCITVASGTEALLISLMALGIGPGDEVITTPFTFIATAEVIVLLGAKPVFVDIEPDTCNINVELIEAKITDKTKAIMPVSLYGQPSDLDEINDIANRYGLPVIEDAAQSFGAEYKGRKSCNLSTVGCTSFFPSKPLGCYGDGGAIFLDDDVLAQGCREVRVHGQSARYLHTRLGVGGRMDTIQCAVVLAKLPSFGREVALRRAVAGRYDKLIQEHVDSGASKTIATPVTVGDGVKSVYAQYTLLVENRNDIQRKLDGVNIPTMIHYPRPVNTQPAYSQLCCPGCTPVSDSVANLVLSLPMGPYLKAADQEAVVARIFS